MAQPLIGFLAFAVGIVVVAIAPVIAVWLIMQILKALGFVVGGTVKIASKSLAHVGRFIRGEVVDSLHFAGSLLTAGVIAPLALGNLALFRLRAAKHYGTAAEDELTGALACLYRMSLGHPVRLVGLGALTDGLERRLPELVDMEPRTGRPGRSTRSLFRTGSRAAKSRGDALRRGEMPTFDGYKLVDELTPGGSGARLFAALPTPDRVSLLQGRGMHVPAKVVIKAFALGYGSTIPQIVRESRSLDAAKKLGLVLEHSLEEDAFHYIMPFVPGNDLGIATREMHASSAKDGLSDSQLKRMLGYSRDLCDHLGRFHHEGLWHKDIKPSNLMVADGRLQVVDFGLLTPLESALTLTTHGTEFFRDPELVRLALAGKRVKDVDGVKFDVYSAGAVLYSMVENSFPAHGSLSSISKRTPEALRWIVRRAMADIDKRYASAGEFGRDLDVLLGARDPFSIRPADLPSVSGKGAPLRRAAYASPSLAAETLAASTPAFAAANEPEKDTKKFEAFGVRAEVHGLGRMRSTMAAARAQHRAKRAAQKEARQRVHAEKRAVRETAKVVRRKRRRGVLLALSSLVVFGMIGGGAATFLASDDAYDSRARQIEQVRERFTSAVSRASSAIQGPRMSPAYATRFEEMIDGSRVLILIEDLSDRDLTVEAERIAEQLQLLDLEPMGNLGRQQGTRARDTDLIAKAKYALTPARRRSRSVDSELKRFTEANDELEAIIYLSKDKRSHNVHTIFAIDKAGLASCEDSCSGSTYITTRTSQSSWSEDDDCDDCDDSSCSSSRSSSRRVAQ